MFFFMRTTHLINNYKHGNRLIDSVKKLRSYQGISIFLQEKIREFQSPFLLATLIKHFLLIIHSLSLPSISKRVLHCFVPEGV